ncbi:MAG: ammonium transporter [Moraxellaceae bacterium]|nr:ammonium transporter [Moraxellaceae bacterium]
MSTFLIVLLVVVAFVVGQWSLLRPSARDTRLMLLRAEARKLGLQPRLLAPPGWYKGERPVGGLLACYSLLTEEGAKGLPYFRAERTLDGEWVVRAGEGTVLRSLSLPPEAEKFIALEAQANAVSIWWSEALGPEALPALQSLLRQMLEKLK